MRNEVFVTYSWEDDAHNERVISFTNFLRRNGFNADMDRSVSQKETAIDFQKMMHQAISKYKKIIIILTSSYKDKAENFKGGVGNEYNMIIKDINDNKNKYVLVSFSKISDNIIPFYFKGREIIHLKDKSSENLLFSKLMDQEIYPFDEVRNSKPNIIKKEINRFIISDIEIIELVLEQTETLRVEDKYEKISYYAYAIFRNNSENDCENLMIEYQFPDEIYEKVKISTRFLNEKIKAKKDSRFLLTSYNIKKENVSFFLQSEIKLKIKSDLGFDEKSFLIKDMAIVEDYMGKRLLIEELFY